MSLPTDAQFDDRTVTLTGIIERLLDDWEPDGTEWRRDENPQFGDRSGPFEREPMSPDEVAWFEVRNQA